MLFAIQTTPGRPTEESSNPCRLERATQFDGQTTLCSSIRYRSCSIATTEESRSCPQSMVAPDPRGPAGRSGARLTEISQIRSRSPLRDRQTCGRTLILNQCNPAKLFSGCDQKLKEAWGSNCVGYPGKKWTGSCVRTSASLSESNSVAGLSNSKKGAWFRGLFVTN